MTEMSSRYVVKAKTFPGMDRPIYFYVHDSKDWAENTMASGTSTYKTEEAAQAVADERNARQGQEQRTGRNNQTIIR